MRKENDQPGSKVIWAWNTDPENSETRANRDAQNTSTPPTSIFVSVTRVALARRSKPTVIAQVLASFRTSVWRIAEAYLKGLPKIIDVDERMKMVTANYTVSSTIKKLIVVMLKEVLEVSGWCRTRWSDETRALQLTTKSRIEVSAKKVRRWLREISGVRNSDLARSTNWHTPARSEIRSVCNITFVIADQLDPHRLSNVDYESQLKRNPHRSDVPWAKSKNRSG